WFSEVQWIHLGAWRALRAQLPDLVEDLFLGGEASLVVLGEDLLPVDADDEDAAAAAHDLTVQAELFLQRGRQTGGSRKVVSNAAIVDANVHGRYQLSVISCPLSVEVGIGYQVSVPNKGASVPIPDTDTQAPSSNRLHQNRGHVLQPAPLVGCIDEDAAGLLEVFRVLLHDAKNLTFRNHPTESVGAA